MGSCSVHCENGRTSGSVCVCNSVRKMKGKDGERKRDGRESGSERNRGIRREGERESVRKRRGERESEVGVLEGMSVERDRGIRRERVRERKRRGEREREVGVQEGMSVLCITQILYTWLGPRPVFGILSILCFLRMWVGMTCLFCGRDMSVLWT